MMEEESLATTAATDEGKQAVAAPKWNMRQFLTSLLNIAERLGAAKATGSPVKNMLSTSSKSITFRMKFALRFLEERSVVRYYTEME